MTSKLDEDIAREVAARLRGYQEHSPLRRFRFTKAFYDCLTEQPGVCPTPARLRRKMGYPSVGTLDGQLAKWRTELLIEEGFERVGGSPYWRKPNI